MFVSTLIYILALFGVLSGHCIFFAFILTALFILAIIKNIFPIKVIVIWTLIFYFGIINTSLRIKDTDDLLNLAPINSIIYGKIISIPENKGYSKTKFFFNIDKIEYDGLVKTFYKLHVYNVVFLLLYTLQHAHHKKFSFHPSPHSLSPLPILPSSPLLLCSLFSVSTWLVWFNLLVFHIPHVSEIIGYSSFSV